MKPLKKLNVEDANNYQKYRVWLESVAHAKKKLLDRKNKQLQVSATIRKQRDILKTLYQEENKLNQEIELIKENLIEVIPNEF